MDEGFLADLQSLCNVGLSGNMEFQNPPAEHALQQQPQNAQVAYQYGEERPIEAGVPLMDQQGLPPSRRGSMISTFSTTTQESLTDLEGHPGKRSRTKVSDEDLRAKNERRLLQCRVSAKLSRERKKQFINTLEGQLVQLQQTKVELEAVVALLLCENERLRQSRCGGPATTNATSAAAAAALSGAPVPALPAGIAAPTGTAPVGGPLSTLLVGGVAGNSAAGPLNGILPQAATLQLSPAALESLKTIRAATSQMGAPHGAPSINPALLTPSTPTTTNPNVTPTTPQMMLGGNNNFAQQQHPPGPQ